MRLCPTPEGNESPLITHRIGVDVCMTRQRCFYHKCHRCQYRGKSAEWQPEAPQTVSEQLAAKPGAGLAPEIRARKQVRAAAESGRSVAKAKATPPAAGKKAAKRPGPSANGHAAEAGG